MGGKAVGLFGSFGWGDGEWMRSWGEGLRRRGHQPGVRKSITCCEAPDDDVLAACQAHGPEAGECFTSVDVRRMLRQKLLFWAAVAVQAMTQTSTPVSPVAGGIAAAGLNGHIAHVIEPGLAV